ncbi:cytochrome P450 720B2 [Jatropha curcas]|uniref:cytochrome P450 720B2 n=1 Tax=Jatropha curcas TaxID=180498 RepID=UPI001893AB30|nr:cytochrome P450 720B2 [Jatropha curcas]
MMFLKQFNKEELLFLLQNKYNDIIIITFFSVAIIAFLEAWRRITASTSKSNEEEIPGGVGVPFFGETFSFLSATNSTRGCYDFVKLRRKWYGKWFKTKMFGKIHVFAPTTEAARQVFSNDFGEFNKGYIKSMATVVGAKSVFAAPLESHTRIRHVLSALFSMPSLSKFVGNFDQILSQRLNKLEQSGKSFPVLEFTMKVTLYCGAEYPLMNCSGMYASDKEQGLHHRGDTVSVDGFEIKKGWNVNVDATFIHFDPALYKDPLLFNPSRFDEMQKPYSFIPFGAGPRTCLGIEMGKLSMLVFLHRLTREYEWRIEDGDPSMEKTTHVPRLKTGLPITLKALNNARQE